MPTLICTEPVCRHEWTEPTDPSQPRCPCCGGFWVRVVPDAGAARPHAPRHHARARLLARRYAGQPR
ncbi:MAG TPA: hypothetical protein VGI54_07695 [Solirubrobacteraceae bacterium]